MTPRFHTLTIKDVRRETPDAVSIAFDVPEDLAAAYHYRPGQYLTVRKDIAGEEVRRSYSICSGLDDRELRIAVKRIDGGVFSNFANEQLSAGMPIDVMTPMGRFVLPEDPGPRTYVAFAAGSGITPIMAQIKTILTREPDSRFHLFYGNRKSQTILFKGALEDLKDRFMSRLSIYHVLSQEAQDVSLLSGRIDEAKVETFLKHVVPVEAVDHFLLCGPGGLIDATRAQLERMGVDHEKIHVELFTPADGSPVARPKPVAEAVGPAPSAKARLTLILDGAAHQVDVAEGETLVDAATRAGVDAPYSCKGGMCCTCRAKVVSGAVDMRVNYSLEPWELEAGFVLTCQSEPTTPEVTVDYDTA
jgi:ring-1,2-phenylacetyl-CoA epoxidase subunit PaaE